MVQTIYGRRFLILRHPTVELFIYVSIYKLFPSIIQVEQYETHLKLLYFRQQSDLMFPHFMTYSIWVAIGPRSAFFDTFTETVERRSDCGGGGVSMIRTVSCSY